MTTYDPKLRRLGYRVPIRPPSPLIGMLQRAGTRPRPMNRAYPARATYIGDCPLCGQEDACYVEPNGEDWMTICVCAASGGLLELHAALMLQAVA